jgi:phage internal scaffolding protein
MKFYTPYNLDSAHADLGVISDFEPSLTVQSERDECDINVLVQRFGVVPEVFPSAASLPTYGDFSGIFDFQSAMNAVLDSQHAFNELPARVRSRFNNDPQQYLEFFDNPDNRDEAVSLGFILPPDPALSGSDKTEAGGNNEGEA